MSLPLTPYSPPLQDCHFFTTLFSLSPYRHHPHCNSTASFLFFNRFNSLLLHDHQPLSSHSSGGDSTTATNTITAPPPPPQPLLTPPQIPMPQLPLIMQYHRIRKAYIGSFFQITFLDDGKQVPLTAPGGMGKVLPIHSFK